VPHVAKSPTARRSSNAPNGQTVPTAQNPPNAPNRSNVPNTPNDPNGPNALLARVIEARGGLAALKNIRTVVAEAVTTMMLQQGQLQASMKTYIAYPDKFRVDAKVGPDDIVQIYNGGSAWEKTPKGVREAPPAMRDDWADSVRRDTIPLLVGAAEGRLQARALSNETRPDGTRVEVLEIAGTRVEPVRFFVNDKSLIVGQVFSKPGADGRAVRSEELFSDYRMVDGIQVPFQARLMQGGRVVLTRTIGSVRFNAPVADGTFDRPN
jgi:hypothetical protein